MGKVFKDLLPPDTPIVAIQAPELLVDSPVLSISERAASYKDALIAEWGNYNQTLNLLGYSIAGPLAYELALTLNESVLDCASLCLVDPSPCIRLPISTESYLM